MDAKTYSLIIFAKPRKDYGIGWLAGSVLAHRIYCNLPDKGKVFWFCPVQYRGINNYDAENFKEMMELILNNKLKIGNNYKDIRLNNYGYFYDGGTEQVLWRYNLEKIFHGDYFKENSKEIERYEKYFGFRDEYLKYSKKYSKKCLWFLISDIQKIVNPIEKKLTEKGKYVLPGFKYGKKRLFTYHFTHGGVVFSPSVPKECNITTPETNIKKDIDSYLKQFFLTKLPNENLREKAIQQAFALTLMQNENWTLELEVKLPNKKRPDIIFEDERGDIVVVEIKRGDENPVDQLKGYVNKIKKQKPRKRVKGLIICGDITDEIMNDSKKQKFDIDLIKYNVSIGFTDKISYHRKF